MKNIEGKNDQKLDAIKDQGKKQLNVIDRQKENKPKIIEENKIVYLEDKKDRIFEIHCKFFTGKNKALLKSIADNEHKISYKNLSYNILLSDGKSHEFNFFKKALCIACWKVC